jgi:TetR/AcrR family transcriptional repressor of nem operon
MPPDRNPTRDRILDTAQELVLATGFAGMSIDHLVQRAGLTKGAFFHHFKSKADLALALVERFARQDLDLLGEMLGRAERLSRDPLQQLLIFVGLYVELFEGLSEPPAGCLLASYCYEHELFDDQVKGVCSSNFHTWRRRLGDRIRAAMAAYPPRLPVDPESLADGFTAAIEGAFVLSRGTAEPDVVARQLTHYRNYLELLFAPAQAPAV